MDATTMPILLLGSGGASSTFGSPCLKLTATYDFCFVGQTATRFPIGCPITASSSKNLIIFYCWNVRMIVMGREEI